jgi:outer membrane lipoprotein-sorting protein
LALSFFVTAALLTAGGPVLVAEAGEQAGWTLGSALKQLDKAAKDFRTAVADVEMVVEGGPDGEPSKSTGKAYFSREGSFRFDLSDPKNKTLLCTGTDLIVYDPAQAIADRYPLAKHPQRVECYASLGFLLTGNALSKDYLVGLLGEESLDDRKTLMLQLTPKSDKVRAAVSRIEIWIEQGSWLPIQQKIFHGDSSQSLTIHYVQTSRNVPVDNALFKPKWPKGTKKITR